MTLSVLVCFKAGNSGKEALVPRRDPDKTALQQKLNVKIPKHVNKTDAGEHLNVFRRFFWRAGTWSEGTFGSAHVEGSVVLEKILERFARWH